MNPFESGERKVVPATLIYVFCENKILMIHRIKKNKDIHEGKWNGIGGKLELEESPQEAALREIEEESGLQINATQLKSLGVLTFPSFNNKTVGMLLTPYFIAVC
jgi:8-oxo-dGTP diphosphatase